MSDVSEADALLFESDWNPEVPYYVDLAGAFSIVYPTADDWAYDEASDGSPCDDDREPVQRLPAAPHHGFSRI